MKGEGRERVAWVVEDIGGRDYFEDAHSMIIDPEGDAEGILGTIFDGHGGSAVAKLAAARFPSSFRGFIESGIPPCKALESAFLEIDKESIGQASGAVAVAFHLHGGMLSFANSGDAELILVSKTEQRTLTELHRTTNPSERRRIISAGGRIKGAYVMAPDGNGLQCTRSLGDHDFKKFGVIPNPHAGRIEVRDDDRWLVAACDGLWDVMRPREVAALAEGLATPRDVAEALAREGLVERRTPDNITVMVVKVGTRESSGKA